MVVILLSYVTSFGKKLVAEQVQLPSHDETGATKHQTVDLFEKKMGPKRFKVVVSS